MMDSLVSILNFYEGASTGIIQWYISINRSILDAIHVSAESAFHFFLYITFFVSAIFFIMSIIALFSKDKRKEYKFDRAKAPFVTIQIPTYNELAALNCADKCLDMDYPKDKYEIIIGDDSNDPEVSKRIDEFAARHKGMVKVTRRGANIGFKPGNLNHMLKYTDGEIIVVFDSDFLPDTNFLKRIVSPFQKDEKIGGVQVRWKFINMHQNAYSLLGSLIVVGFHQVYLPFMKKIGGVSFLCGSAEAVRKDLLVRLGGWKSGSLTEDIEYSIRLINAGYRIHYLEDLECFCEAPFTAKDLFKQQMRWSFGVTKSLVTHFPAYSTNRRLKVKDKVLIPFQGIGYLFSFLVVMLFTTGFISFMSHPPAPIDIARFSFELARNVLLSSGVVFASWVGLWKTNGVKHTLKALRTSFTVGLVVVFYVNLGVFKALLGREMHWFMLKKQGNTSGAAVSGKKIE